MAKSRSPEAIRDRAIRLFEDFFREVPDAPPDGERFATIHLGDKQVPLSSEWFYKWADVVNEFARFAEAGRHNKERVDRLVHSAGKHGTGGVASLRKTLAQPTITHDVLVPLHGFEDDVEPFTFGQLSIYPISELPRLNEELQEKHGRNKREIPNPDHATAFAHLNVQALDGATALEVALDVVRLSLSVLNFFSWDASRSAPHARLAFGPACQMLHPRAFNQNHQSTGYRSRGSNKNFAPSALAEDEVFRAADKWLAQSSRASTENLVIASMSWAGRAVKEPEHHMAYLQWAVSCENALIPQDNHEVTDRQALRAAYLLSSTAAERSYMFKTVKHLYTLRSKIAHNARTYVPEVDRALMASFARVVITKVVELIDRRSLRSLEDLEAWYRDLVLGLVDLNEAKEQPSFAD